MAWLLPQEDGHNISQSWEWSVFSKFLGFVASQRNSPPQKPGDTCVALRLFQTSMCHCHL